MDSRDQELIDLLSQDARQSVSLLAQKLGMARTTLQARLEKLERSGVVAGYTVRLGDVTQAARITSTVLVQMEPGSVAPVTFKLKKMAGVKRVLTCSGRFDLILEVDAASPSELDKLLDDIGDIAEITSSESLIHLTERFNRHAL